MTPLWRKWWVYAIALAVIIGVLITVTQSGSEADVQQTPAEFLNQVRAGLVDRVEVDGTTLTYKLNEGTDITYSTELEENETVRAFLTDNGIAVDSAEFPLIENHETSTASKLLSIILTFIPIIIIISFFAFLWRRVRGPWTPGHAVTNLNPVCSTTVNPGSSAGSSTFMDTTYYFCSAEHKDQFDADPARYLLRK